MMEANLLYRCYDRTGEAATWLADPGLFLWVDIDNGILHQYHPDSRTVENHHLPEMISSVVPWKGHEQEVILSMKNRLVAYHLEEKTFRTLFDFVDLHPSFRLNDCKASPEGRLWCGIMHMEEHEANGCLYRVDRDLSSKPVLRRQHIPNGIVWNKAGDRMFYADSGRSCIEEYAYDSLTGEIRFLRTVIQVPSENGVPDGMTIDANGFLWVAHWGGFGVYVWNPATGELVDKVEIPVPNVASCTFGGDCRNQLFITTALDGLSPTERESYPLSGSLFVADISHIVPGENHYSFVTDIGCVALVDNVL